MRMSSLVSGLKKHAFFDSEPKLFLVDIPEHIRGSTSRGAHLQRGKSFAPIYNGRGMYKARHSTVFHLKRVRPGRICFMVARGRISYPSVHRCLKWKGVNETLVTLIKGRPRKMERNFVGKQCKTIC